MIPWALGAAVVLAVPRLLRNDRSIFSAAMCATLLGANCFVASILLPDNTLRFIALAIGGPLPGAAQSVPALQPASQR
jgi:hypothetical protein